MCLTANYYKNMFVFDQTDLSQVVVPQLLMQPVRMSFLPLDLSDDIKDLGVRVGAAGAAASLVV